MSTHIFPSSFRRKPGWHLHCEGAKPTQVKRAFTPRVFVHRVPPGSGQNLLVFAYLEAYFKVFTELGAAAQFAVQALVNKAVQLVGAIAAVVFMVAEQCLINAVSIVADVSSLVAFLLCKRKVEREVKEGGKGQLVMLKCCQSREIISVRIQKSFQSAGVVHFRLVLKYDSVLAENFLQLLLKNKFLKDDVNKFATERRDFSQ